MKRADFSNGPHPVCAGSCGGSCGAYVNLGGHQDIPVFAMNSANEILKDLKKRGLNCGK